MSKDWGERPAGYPQYAAFIAADPDKSTTVYRRFERLAARNLLYLESKLIDLEAKQDDLDNEVENIEPISILNEVNLQEVKNRMKELERDMPQKKDAIQLDQDTPEKEQCNANSQIPDSAGYVERRLGLAKDIRTVLKEYYEALKLESDILALNKPAKRVLKNMQKYFDEPDEEGNPDTMLKGNMASHLQDEQDLCVLAPPVERDRLTMFFQGPFSWAFRKNNSDYIPHERVALVVTVFSIIAATAFLVGAVFGLYYVKDNILAQLIMLSCFTISFAGCLGLLTNARRQDVFAATAAYAAVLVVFVSGNLAPTPVADCSSCPSSTTSGPTSATTTPKTSIITSTTPTATIQTSSSVWVGHARVGVIVAIVSAATTVLIAILALLWRVSWLRPKRWFSRKNAVARVESQV